MTHRRMAMAIALIVLALAIGIGLWFSPASQAQTTSGNSVKITATCLDGTPPSLLVEQGDAVIIIIEAVPPTPTPTAIP